jgi:hypothetical protein
VNALVTWIEGTWLSSTLNDIVWLWPLAESLHFIGLALVIGGSGLLDLRLLGLFRSVPIPAIKAFMPWAVGGFVTNAVTGIAFIIMAPHMYLLSAVWWWKAGFIALAGLNAMFFETRLSATALALEPGEDTPMPLKMVGGLSLVSWFAVLYCGRMLPYLGLGN